MTLILNSRRPNNQIRIMSQLDLLSKYSTCQRLQTAAGLVNHQGMLLMTSVNGAPAGQPHCNEQPKLDERCFYCIHCEKNLINKAARYGLSITELTLWITHRPCVSCANDIVQTGIAEVCYRWDYDTDGKKQYVLDMFKNSGIDVYQTIYTEEEMTFNEKLEEWMKTWQT